MRERWEKIQEFQRECPFFSEPSRMDFEAFAKKKNPQKKLSFCEEGGERLSRNIVKTAVNIAIYGIHAPLAGCDFFLCITFRYHP